MYLKLVVHTNRIKFNHIYITSESLKMFSTTQKVTEKYIYLCCYLGKYPENYQTYYQIPNKMLNLVGSVLNIGLKSYRPYRNL